MADIKDVINGLECCTNFGCHHGCAYLNNNGCRSLLEKDALELLKKLNWIPSSEKLPDEYDPVLVWSKKSGHEIMHIEKDGMSDNGVEWVNEHDYSIGIIGTWWMPLPKTPKGGDS